LKLLNPEKTPREVNLYICEIEDFLKDSIFNFFENKVVDVYLNLMCIEKFFKNEVIKKPTVFTKIFSPDYDGTLEKTFFKKGKYSDKFDLKNDLGLIRQRFLLKNNSSFTENIN
jgi:hypothetical protein